MESKETREICGTCMFWNGNREHVESKPKISIFGEFGTCQCPISSKSGENRKNNNQCKEWKKWGR